MEDDNDLLTVLVRSLVDPMPATDEVILLALIRADGSVEKAAQSIILGQVTNTVDDRKGKRRQGKIDNWFGTGASTDGKDGSPSSSSSSPATKRTRIDPSTAPPPDTPARPKKPQDLLALAALRPPPSTVSSPSAPPSLPPLLLPTAAMLAKHLDCITMPTSPISPQLANALYLTILADSTRWEPVTYVINGKEVSSPHTSRFYASSRPSWTASQHQEAALYWYNGKPTPPPLPFPPLLQEAADLIEEVVNRELKERMRYEGEWLGPWKAEVAAVNRYEGGEQGVGPHADQLTYLGPYPTIASLSLGTSRLFQLRAVPPKDPIERAQEPAPRTFNVALSNNTLLIMHPPTQERYKHSVPPQKAIDLFRPAFDEHQQPVAREDRTAHKARIGITFRFYRPDFSPTPTPGLPHAGTPRCLCDVPCVLKADQRKKIASHRASSAATASDSNPYVFFWMCNRKAGTASGDGSGPGGCGFFRVLDLKAEQRGGEGEPDGEREDSRGGRRRVEQEGREVLL